MNLIAFALCTVPDLAGARQLHAVDDLDDRAVAKILFHRRKQQTGKETLRPDQQRIAVISLVHGEPEHPRLLTLSAANEDEATMLRHLAETLGGTGRLAGWRPAEDLAVLRLRCTALGVTAPRLWQGEHIDVAEAWGAEAPLDEASRLMGLPGLGEGAGKDIWDAWSEGDQDTVQACADLRALNTWQLAQKVAIAQGRLTPIHARNGVQALRRKLGDSPHAYLRDFAARLEA